jgi:hydrogenase expression/formation protein HypD
MIDLNNYFKDPELAQKVALKISEESLIKENYHFMEFCGGHTHAIFRHGVQSYLPKNIKMIHGPGCPVCVLPVDRIDYAIHLSKLADTVVTTYGDLMRIPGSQGKSLLQSRASGAKVAMVYSPLDALKMARENPDKRIVFFAIGFETTAPATAHVISEAHRAGLKNFFVVCNHLLTPSAITHILESPEVRELGSLKLDGFLGPAHVSTVIGLKPYEFFAEEFQKPVVISGLEPLDVLISILMLIRQVNTGVSKVENQFIRAVTYDGNLLAKKAISDVFTLRKNFRWRGMGVIPYSAMLIKDEYAYMDIEKIEAFNFVEPIEHKACRCPAILRGMKTPLDCKLFGKLCNPENPVGSCMVSSEGACAAYYSYGRFIDERK